MRIVESLFFIKVRTLAHTCQGILKKSISSWVLMIIVAAFSASHLRCIKRLVEYINHTDSQS